MAVYELCGIAALARLAVDHGRLVDGEYVAVEAVRLAVVLSRVTVPPRLVVVAGMHAYRRVQPHHALYASVATACEHHAFGDFRGLVVGYELRTPLRHAAQFPDALHERPAGHLADSAQLDRLAYLVEVF